MFFIILTAALTLNKAGITEITSSKEAALALKPLAGEFAIIIFTIAIITGGALAIPTLAASAAYAFAENFNWKQGLNSKYKEAPAFYRIIVISIICAVIIDFMKINPFQALFWSAVINGVLAPFLLIGILAVARDSKIMVGKTSSRINQLMVFLTIVIMFAAMIAMFIL